MIRNRCIGAGTNITRHLHWAKIVAEIGLLHARQAQDSTSLAPWHTAQIVRGKRLHAPPAYSFLLN